MAMASRKTFFPFLECISCSDEMTGIHSYATRRFCDECGGFPINKSGYQIPADQFDHTDRQIMEVKA